jgi:phosphoribosyl 1,2-cyclic phosphate phosphodiesterase
MRTKFGYCFETPAGSEYPPIAQGHRAVAGEPITINGAGGAITALPVLQEHGDIPSLGYRFGGLAYSCDVNGLPDTSVTAFADLDVWIVDALRYAPHPSHFALDDTLHWIDRLKPRRAILTNLHSDLDYEVLRRRLPAHIEPAHDGLKLTLST